jgi:hypothetical protein
MLQRSSMAQEDSSTRSRLWAHDIEMQWVYRGSGSIVAVGLSWQWVYRGSGSIVAVGLS